MLLGIGITAKSHLPGNPVLSVEYHQCDKCGAEFRLYFKSKNDMDSAIAEIGRKLTYKNGDLCYNCKNPIMEQLVMSLK